jgi:hypothetical protein
MAQLTADLFTQGANDPRLGDRLALAGTAVHIVFADGIGCTLRMDRGPIEAERRIVGDV